MVPLVVISESSYVRHRTPDRHPESPQRITSILKAIHESEWASQIPLISPRMATVEEIALCHIEAYIQLVQKECAGLTHRIIKDLSTGDVTICNDSYEIALLAAGGALTAVDMVLQGKAKRAFAAIRPPGHHAESHQGMGFCLFNNIAVAACYAMQKYHIQRVLIIDWDVHHGNGTQEIFYENPHTFYFSTHQWPLYPGTGEASETGHGRGLGTTLNVPIQAGPGSTEQIFKGFDELDKRMRIFRPQLVMISAGFDAHKMDPIGGLELIEEDFLELTKRASQIANKYAHGRIVSVLEGGYNLEALASSVLAHLQGLQLGHPQY